uniref:Uncharacterized protein n=1 Tax=Escherichia virus LS3 TaxID=2743777 RepID=A0A7D5FW36_9CAUD
MTYGTTISYTALHQIPKLPVKWKPVIPYLLELPVIAGAFVQISVSGWRPLISDVAATGLKHDWINLKVVEVEANYTLTNVW